MIPAIETRDLSFHYRDAPVLRDIRICFNPGEMVAILGPNGSGKTTLLKALTGVLLGTGEVKVKGRPVKSHGKRDLSRIFAVVPQESLVQFPYTVAELVLMGRASRHGAFALEGKKDVEVARACMQFTGVLPLATMIRDNKLFQLPSLMQRGRAFGMIRLDDSLAEHVRAKRLTEAVALAAAENKKELAAVLSPRSTPASPTLTRGLFGPKGS